MNISKSTLANYRKALDPQVEVLTDGIVSQVRTLTNGNAGLSCLCLHVIAGDFREPEFNAKEEFDIVALIAKGDIDKRIELSAKCRAFRTINDINEFMKEKEIKPELFIQFLGKLVKEGPIKSKYNTSS